MCICMYIYICMHVCIYRAAHSCVCVHVYVMQQQARLRSRSRMQPPWLPCPSHARLTPFRRPIPLLPCVPVHTARNAVPLSLSHGQTDIKFSIPQLATLGALLSLWITCAGLCALLPSLAPFFPHLSLTPKPTNRSPVNLRKYIKLLRKFLRFEGLVNAAYRFNSLKVRCTSSFFR